MILFDTYRNAFNLTNKLSTTWDDNTLLLYFSIVLGCILISKSFCNIRDYSNSKIQKQKFVCLGLILWFFFGFRGSHVGMDTPQYRLMFTEALTTNIFDSDMEPGFLLLNRFVYLLVPSVNIYMISFAGLIIILIFRSIWGYRHEIDIFTALLCYVGMYYFQAFSLQRIYLSAAIVLWGYRYILEGNYLRFLIILLLTTLCVHFSSAILLLPFAYLLIYQKNKKITLIITGICFFSIIPIANMSVDYINIARYAQYLEDGVDQDNSIGLMSIFDYVPAIITVYVGYRRKLFSRWFDLLIAFTITGLFTRLFAYFIPVVGRLSILFIALYVLIIPYFIKQIRSCDKTTARYLRCCMMVFIFVKLHFYFYEYLSVDALMPYKFIWND